MDKRGEGVLGRTYSEQRGLEVPESRVYLGNYKQFRPVRGKGREMAW